MTKVAFKKVFRFRIFSPHLKSSQFHEPSRSCDRWISFHIENSFGTWTQSSLTDTNKMTKVAFKKVFRFRIFSPHLRSSQFHEPSRSCECWISFHIENSFGTWTQSSLTDTNKMTKVAFKKVFRFRIFSPHLKSSQFHEPSRSCECWILFHIENSFGTWTQSSLTDTNKMTKVAFKKVFRFRIFSPHLKSSQFHEPSRSCECWILFHIENSFGTWTQSSLTDTNKMTKVAFKKVFRFRIFSPHLRSSQFHEPSRSCECWILFHIENSFGTWTQSSLTDTNKMTKVAFKKVFRFRIFSPHLKSSQFHEPSRSCECWISFHIENSFGTWTQSSLTDTNKMTKVAFKKVFRFRIFSPHLKSSQFHEPSRSCECWILFHIENSFGTWTQSSLTDTNKMTKVAFKKCSASGSFRLI